MKARGKVIVVTGAGNGMGREITLLLLAKGASVAAVDLSAAALAETVRLAGEKKERLSTWAVNITQRDAVEALPEQIAAKHGAVDGIINNAGIIQPFVRLKDLGYDAVDRVMGVNFFGTLYMTKAFLPHLLQRPEAHIVNIASMGGFLPVPGQTVYGASKAAVKLLTEGLHSELAETNVRVTVVFPGAVGTDIAANSGVTIAAPEAQQDFKMLAPAEAAKLIVAGMESDRYRVLVGKDARLMDAVYRLHPERAAAFIYRQMKALLPK